MTDETRPELERERIAFLPETLAEYFALDVRTSHVLADAPRCVMDVDPLTRSLRLRMPLQGPPADVSRFERLSFDETTVLGETEPFHELSIDADGIEFEGYALIEAIVDRLVRGDGTARAIDGALRTHRDLLAGRRRLSEEEQLGLFGELEVLLHLVDAIGERDAVDAWLGPVREEHDFLLAGVDLEVKTTRSERRVHVIAAPGQLASSPGRDLYLVSLQYTPAGLARDGETLPQRVARVRGRLGESLAAFDDKLLASGWDDRDAEELYRARHLRRSTPRAYLVDDDFPAITDDDIARLTHRPDLIVGVRYGIDVTTLAHSAPPTELAQLCERTEP